MQIVRKVLMSTLPRQQAINRVEWNEHT